MKIIGKTDRGYIIDASNSEVQSLLGKSDSRRELIKHLAVGDEITFTTALQNLNLIKTLQLDGSYDALGRVKDAKKKIDEVVEIVEGLLAPLVEVRKLVLENQT